MTKLAMGVVTAGALVTAAPALAQAQKYPFLGTWTCPSGVLTITEKMHSVGTSQSPIAKIVRKSDAVHHVFLGPDEVKLRVSGKQLFWSQLNSAPNDDMTCKR